MVATRYASCSVARQFDPDTPFFSFQAFSTQSICVAMALHPHVLKKAQAELDAVVGFQRMLEFSDLQSLVYLQAVTKEAMRWHNTVPLCIPHATLEDDELHGFFVPAGTVIMPNIWCVPSYA